MFLHLSSSDSKDLYPQNNPYDFVTELPLSIDTDEDNWYCGLVAFVQSRSTDDVTVLCNIVDTSYIRGKYRTVLRQINNTGTYFGDVSNIQYMGVRVPRINRIHIQIVDSVTMEPLTPVADTETRLVLHLKKL